MAFQFHESIKLTDARRLAHIDIASTMLLDGQRP